MKYRKINLKKDLKYLLSTQQDLFYPNREYKLTKGDIKDFKINMINHSKNKDYLILIGEEKNKQVGYIIIQFRKSLNNKKIIVIEDVFTNKNHRKKGIAQKLIEKVKDIAKDRQYKRIELLTSPINKPAINLYKKCGFKKRIASIEFSLDLK